MLLVAASAGRGGTSSREDGQQRVLVAVVVVVVVVIVVVVVVVDTTSDINDSTNDNYIARTHARPHGSVLLYYTTAALDRWIEGEKESEIGRQTGRKRERARERERERKKKTLIGGTRGPPETAESFDFSSKVEGVVFVLNGRYQHAVRNGVRMDGNEGFASRFQMNGFR